MSVQVKPPDAVIVAVLVTFHPDVVLLQDVLRAIFPQVDRVFVFDNGSRQAELQQLLRNAAWPSLDVVYSPHNVGLAAGMNAGIAAARAQGASHVLLLDQDSVPAPDMVAALLRGLAAEPNGTVAAVGPVFVDRRSGAHAPFVRIRPLWNKKHIAAAGSRVEADFLISSGSLIPLQTLDQVGDMDAALFIDNVDLEWSFRARRLGFRLLGIGDARMQHAIGDRLRTCRIFGTTWRFPLHSPLRLYYMTRNRLTLYARTETPWQWIAQDIPRLGLKFLGMTLLQAPRITHVRYMLRGIRDAFLGRLGQYDSGNSADD